MHTPETFAIEAGRAISLLRVRLKLSSQTLAMESGISVPELRAIESGDFDYLESVNDSSALSKVCRRLGVQVQDLVGPSDAVF